jgi:type II secretory pathway component GspD/PulD (secretin)
MRVTLRRLLAVAVLAAVPLAARAEAPTPPTPGKADTLAAARKALDEAGDMNYQGRSLADVIDDLKAKTKVPVVIDAMVYNFGLDPSQPTVNVNLKGVKLRDGLTAVLSPYNLKFGLTRDGLFISTEEGVITRQLRQRVSLDCDGTEFAAAARQLAADTGANVVVDPRLGDRAKAAVTLKLDDVPLETAVRLLAEVADLRAVRMSNVLFVTTPEKAKGLREDADGPTQPAPANPFFPGGGINPLPAPGVIGGFGGVQILPAGPAAAGPDTPVQAPPVPPEKPAPANPPPRN